MMVRRAVTNGIGDEVIENALNHFVCPNHRFSEFHLKLKMVTWPKLGFLCLEKEAANDGRKVQREGLNLKDMLLLIFLSTRDILEEMKNFADLMIDHQ